MRVLITGADGYIGAVLCDVLETRHHEIVTLDTSYYADGWLAPQDAPGPRTMHLRHDIRAIVPEDLRGVDAVVHLAELSNDPLCQVDPSLTYAINHQGTVRLARMAREAGIERFVYTSSCSVYGASGPSIKDEASPLDPQTAYAHCKQLVERDLSEMADGWFTPVFLRNATAYGASPRMRFDLVVNNLTGWAYTEGAVRLMSDGMAWRPLVHVRDIARAIALALDAPARVVRNQVFNVGSDRDNHLIRDIADMVHGVLPDAEVVFGARGADNRTYRVRFRKIEEELGFHCEMDARAGMEELVRLYRAAELTSDSFQFRAFTRVKQLEHLKQTRQLDDRLFWRTPARRESDESATAASL